MGLLEEEWMFGKSFSKFTGVSLKKYNHNKQVASF